MAATRGYRPETSVLLPRIRSQVVKLGPRRPDELPAARLHREELAPPVVEAGVVGLGVGHRPGERLRRTVDRALRIRRRSDRRRGCSRRLVGHHRQEAGAVEAGRHGEPGEVEQCRRDVHEAGQAAHAPAGQREGGRADLGTGWWREDQRHVERGAVQEDAVSRLAVLAQRLAVVGEVGDQGVAAQAPRVERLEQPLDLRVGVHHLAGVGRGCPAVILVRRRVGLVRIEEVDPEVEGASAASRLAEPGEGVVHDLSRRPLEVGEVAALEPRVVEGIVVGLVALGEAPSRVNDVGADESRGPVAVLAEPLRERRRAGAQHEAAVVANRVVGGEKAREEGRVGGQRQGNLRDRVLEQHPLSRQARGRRRLERRAVGGQVVAPQRVDGDHDHVGVGEARALH